MQEPEPIDLGEPNHLPINGSDHFVYDHGAALRLLLTFVGSVVAGLLFAVFRDDEWSPLVLYIVFAVLAVITLCVILYLQSASKRSIGISFDQHVVTLRHMVYPIRFWDIMPKREVRIPFNEIRDIDRRTGKTMYCYTVHTAHSRFVFSEHFTRADDLADHLRCIASGTKKTSLFRRLEVLLMIGAAAVFAGAIILAAGWSIGWI